ncbi:flagellar basal body-associated FliL family protein [Piscirickettsia salmonis]|uniref:flagellar basal body-associated FliL family protein n=1 Tax=Piscirickettsia salmonis TaxID=1238 RepID=UPI003A8134CB
MPETFNYGYHRLGDLIMLLQYYSAQYVYYIFKTRFLAKMNVVLALFALFTLTSLASISYASTNKVVYVPIRPIFVTNLQDSTRKFLSIEVSLMVPADKKTEDAIKNNMPLIKDTLVELFSNQSSKKLRKAGKRAELEKKALTQVVKILNEYVGNLTVKKVLFTKFTIG